MKQIVHIARDDFTFIGEATIMKCRAIELNHEALGREVVLVDYQGEEHIGRIERIELYNDPQHRVIVHLSTLLDTESGEKSRSYFGGMKYINRDATVHFND